MTTMQVNGEPSDIALDAKIKHTFMEIFIFYLVGSQQQKHPITKQFKI